MKGLDIRLMMDALVMRIIWAITTRTSVMLGSAIEWIRSQKDISPLTVEMLGNRLNCTENTAIRM